MARVSYITIAPVTRTGKWTVASRRIGSRDRYTPIATANNETVAEQIVDALNRYEQPVFAQAAE